MRHSDVVARLSILAFIVGCVTVCSFGQYGSGGQTATHADRRGQPLPSATSGVTPEFDMPHTELEVKKEFTVPVEVCKGAELAEVRSLGEQGIVVVVSCPFAGCKADSQMIWLDKNGNIIRDLRFGRRFAAHAVWMDPRQEHGVWFIDEKDFINDNAALCQAIWCEDHWQETELCSMPQQAAYGIHVVEADGEILVAAHRSKPLPAEVIDLFAFIAKEQDLALFRLTGSTATLDNAFDLGVPYAKGIEDFTIQCGFVDGGLIVWQQHTVAPTTNERRIRVGRVNGAGDIVWRVVETGNSALVFAAHNDPSLAVVTRVHESGDLFTLLLARDSGEVMPIGNLPLVLMAPLSVSAKPDGAGCRILIPSMVGMMVLDVNSDGTKSSRVLVMMSVQNTYRLMEHIGQTHIVALTEDGIELLRIEDDFGG